MKNHQSYNEAFKMIQTLDQKVWDTIAEKTISKHVPFNIKKLNTHNIQSFVFMNSKPIVQLDQIKGNRQNTNTLIQTIAKNRIKSKRVNTEVINETPQKIQMSEEKPGQKGLFKSSLKKKQTLKSQGKSGKSSLRTSKIKMTKNEFKNLQRPQTIDYVEQALRNKKNSQEEFQQEEIRRELQLKQSRQKNYHNAREKFKSAQSEIAYDFDGNFFSKKGAGQLKNEKLFELRSNYGSSQISNQDKVTKNPIKKNLKNQMIQMRDKEIQVTEKQQIKKNKNIKVASVQQFIDNFKDQTLSEGVKFGEVSTNTWKQKKTYNKKKLLSLRDFQNQKKIQKFKEFQFAQPKTSKMKLKTVEAQFTGRKVETLQVIPNSKLAPINDKFSLGRKKIKTMFGSEQESLQRLTKFSKLSKLNGSETTKGKKGLITVGNFDLYEQVISQV